MPMRWFLLSLLTACASKSAEKPAAILPIDTSMDVEIAVAQAGPTPDWWLSTGTVIADRQVQVAADANGVITATYVERGQAVKAGDLLAMVDTRIAAAQADASRAQADASRAQLLAAQQECTRSEKLYADGVISTAQYERTVAQCTATARTLEAALGNATVASTSLGKSRIKAPFSGLIGDRMVEVGAFVGPSSTIVSLYDPDPLKVRFMVPEAQAEGVSQGQLLQFSPSTVADLTVDAAVRYISPALRESTRDLVVEAEINAPDNRLRPGQFGVVRLLKGNTVRPLVPESALRTEGDHKLIFVVSNGRALVRVVRSGDVQDGQVPIFEGLAEGESYVTAPSPDLHDGQKVE